VLGLTRVRHIPRHSLNLNMLDQCLQNCIDLFKIQTVLLLLEIAMQERKDDL